ncbi:MAG: hypothetical protein WCW16_04095 [Candidatus Magasanikbacteria bacterium]
MGFFSYVFGFGTGSKTLSSTEHAVTREDIERLVSRSRINTLESDNQAHTIREAVAKRRNGDGKISIQQIDEVLRKLENSKDRLVRISEYDRRGVVKVFEEYFQSKI